MTATLTSTDALLKDYYAGSELEIMLMEKQPFLAAVPKRTDFGGRRAILPLTYSPTAGVSHTFAGAQASKADAADVDFQITTNDLFSLFSIDHKTAQMAKGEPKTYANVVTSRSDAAMAAYKKVLGHALFKNHGGALARIQTRAATRLTMTLQSDMQVFDTNMQIQPSTADGTTGSVINDIVTITAVNRYNRTIDGAAFDATNYQATNYVFLRGGFGAAFRGLPSWLPTTAPSGGESYFGVDRSVDTRLYGVIITADPAIDDTLSKFLIMCAERVNIEGGEVDTVVMNPLTCAQWIKQLDGKVEYDDMQAQGSSGPIAKVGFRTPILSTSFGDIKVLRDHNCPIDTAYFLTMKTWRLWSAGPMMGFLTYEDDDSKFLRHGTENAMEGRIGGYLQLCCSAPGWNGVATLTGLVDT